MKVGPKPGRQLSGFGRPPAKGTSSRRFLLMALRPQGVTSWEFLQTCGMSKGALSGLVTRLENEKGYNIRLFPLSPAKRTLERVGPLGMTGRNPPWVWRLVGKLRWDGSYRSFIDKELN